jgi:hypothetical protein
MPNKRMQSDFRELALHSAADAGVRAKEWMD